VTVSSLEVYLTRLRHELRRRWLDDDRFVEEAREHLVDRIEDGVQRGLSRDAAEQDAFRGFGSPETIADCAAAERYPLWNRWGAFAVIWDRKWWIVVLTISMAVLEMIASPYVVPVRYRPEAFMELRQVSTDTPPSRDGARLQAMSESLTKIVEPPKAPEQPLGPSPAQLGALGGSTGLVVGIALISILHRWRNVRASSMSLPENERITRTRCSR
jgi:hypothetical protein